MDGWMDVCMYRLMIMFISFFPMGKGHRWRIFPKYQARLDELPISHSQFVAAFFPPILGGNAPTLVLYLYTNTKSSPQHGVCWNKKKILWMTLWFGVEEAEEERDKVPPSMPKKIRKASGYQWVMVQGKCKQMESILSFIKRQDTR
jgi:hypothetical protein